MKIGFEMVFLFIGGIMVWGFAVYGFIHFIKGVL